ncbi:MAG: NAD(P)-dependent oxidoreductase [Endomicrobiia bacterium]
MKILITGANGFIGSSLVKYLTEDYKINILIRKTSNVEKISNVINKTKVYYGDIRFKETLVEPIKDSDIVIHTAAVLRCIKNTTYFEVNHVGTKNLVDVILQHGKNIKGIIYISSLAAFGPSTIYTSVKTSEENPVSFYGKSKLLAEKEVLRCKDKITTIILRPSAVYGPYDKDMFLYFKLAKSGILPYFSKNFSIQFTYIKDLIKVIKKILENFNKFKSEVFFVAEEKCYSIFELRDILSKIIGKKILLVRIPYFIAYLYALLNEKLSSVLFKKAAVFNTDKLRELSYSCWRCFSGDILKYISFKYTEFQKGAFETYLWYKQNGWL